MRCKWKWGVQEGDHLPDKIGSVAHVSCALSFLPVSAWNMDTLELQEPTGNLEDKSHVAKCGEQKWNTDDTIEL